MDLTRKDVETIAHLARLQITEKELPQYVDSLSRILNFVEQLDRADTSKVEPMANPCTARPSACGPTRSPSAMRTTSISATRRRSRHRCTWYPKSSSEHCGFPSV